MQVRLGGRRVALVGVLGRDRASVTQEVFIQELEKPSQSGAGKDPGVGGVAASRAVGQGGCPGAPLSVPFYE